MVRWPSLLAGLALLCASTIGATQDGTDPVPVTWLCRALEMIGPGQQIPLEVTGVLKGKYFYDPKEVSCLSDVQPSTLFELNGELPQAAAEILKRDHRLLLKVAGTLYGPRVPADSSLELPLALRISNQLISRYGFDHDFRTKLVVEKVLEAKEVPPELPWNAAIVRPEPGGPQIAEAKLPTYPDQARRLGVQGFVVLEIEVVRGKVSDVRVVASDDPILASSAKENVSTWSFKDYVSTRFVSEFHYMLERRLSQEDDNPRIEARLPSFVRIVGPTLDW